MPEFTKNPDELGALWSKTGGKGEYMTGTIGGVAVVCFRNDNKTPGSKQPDWRVLKSKPKDGPRVVQSDDDHQGPPSDFPF